MTVVRPRVLLVDDMDDNLCALEVILRPLDLDLVRADSGQEAMKALLREDFALILMDVVMPGMDGFETAARIKRLSQTRDVPIIFLSAYDRTPEYVFRSRSVGAADYLTKPFDPWVLRVKVEAFIGLGQRPDGTGLVPAARPPGRTGILADLGACLSRLETTVPRLEGGLAGASRVELAGIAAELAGQVRDLRTAVDALTGARQAGDDLGPAVPSAHRSRGLAGGRPAR
jgi:CheY-like chemotaxis protein